jgi:vacuolar-type H+-ATPase subunit H
VGKGKFREAKDVVRRLPDEPQDLKDLKRNLLGQIDEAEQHGQVQKRIEAAVEESKKLVGKGKFREAKDIIRQLPDQPSELKELKKNFLGQIEQVEQDANKIQAENKEILSRLSRRNIDWSKVGRIASDNNVDMSNPFAFNSLLKAIDEQLRGR